MVKETNNLSKANLTRQMDWQQVDNNRFIHSRSLRIKRCLNQWSLSGPYASTSPSSSSADLLPGSAAYGRLESNCTDMAHKICNTDGDAYERDRCSDTRHLVPVSEALANGLVLLVVLAEEHKKMQRLRKPGEIFPE